MSKEACCPVRIGKHGGTGKGTKKEFETMSMWNCIGLPEEFLLLVVVS